MKEAIVIKGARENNLKNVSLTIPKYKLVVLTGPSGSGKSTLAMDTLQRECQSLRSHPDYYFFNLICPV